MRQEDVWASLKTGFDSPRQGAELGGWAVRKCKAFLSRPQFLVQVGPGEPVTACAIQEAEGVKPGDPTSSARSTQGCVPSGRA